MRKFLPLLFVSIFASIAGAQTPSPIPTPTPDGDVVRISTNVIQLDATVTDSKGKVVTDLRRDEIEIYANGKKQDISGFSFVDGKQVNTTAGKVTQSNSKQPTYLPRTGGQRPENVRRTIALVVDDLTLSFASTFFVQKAIKKFVNEQMQEGDLVAIIRTGGGVGTLQQFTMDRNQLLAAADKIKFSLSVSQNLSSFEPIRVSHNEEMATQGLMIDRTAAVEKEREFDREANEFRNSTFMRGTLGALNFIIRGLSDLPGRKSIVLISEGMRLYTRDASGRQSLSETYDVIRRMIDHANRASVVFYTLDPRGMDVPMASAEDDVRDVFDTGAMAKLTERENELRDTQEGLRFIAKGTGGLAYINQNDISKGIEKVLDDQSYYLLAYEPEDGTFDPKTRQFNKIEVRVTRPGLKVRYRSGFFAFSEEQLAKAKPTDSSTLVQALISPFSANEIQVKLNPVIIAASKDKVFARSYLHLDTSNLTFVKQEDGSFKTKFEVAGVAIDSNGGATDWSAGGYELSIPAAMYDRMKERGIVQLYTYEIKKPGPFQYRVAIRDTATDKVGSANQFVNVPNIKKSRLALSGIIFEDASKLADDGTVRTTTDPTRDTAVRQFRQGSVIRYGLDIYNAIAMGAQAPNLTTQARIYREGTLIYEGPKIPVKTTSDAASFGISTTGVIRIGEKMAPGEHVIEIVVTDNRAKGRYAVASQMVTFEVVGK